LYKSPEDLKTRSNHYCVFREKLCWRKKKSLELTEEEIIGPMSRFIGKKSSPEEIEEIRSKRLLWPVPSSELNDTNNQ
jgi:hypothetical protein